jgi:hypothetical protein
MRPLALCITFAICAVGLFLIFARNSNPDANRLGDGDAVRPAADRYHGEGAANHIAPADWVFNYKRDGKSYGLSEEQCYAAFPKLFVEVDRAVEHRRSIGKNISLSEVEVGWRGDGIVRVLVRDNHLYIVEARGVQDRNHRQRSVATLHGLNRAITAYQGKLPDVEFSITDHDSAMIDMDSNITTLAYSRLPKQETLWLMPDFGFWSWPYVGMRSYAELQASLDESEDDFLDKVPKAVWRGGLKVAGADLRRKLIEVSRGQSWADIRAIDWKNATDIEAGLISMEDHCDYMFTVQSEGNTYSGRLKYLLNCHSIVLSHELNWIEHFHHLLRSSGSEQNYIKLRRDFSDLPTTIKKYLHPPTLQDTGRLIADNARRMFKERYLTPAAEACYWRALIRGWASVQGFEPQKWMETKEPDWHDGSGGSKIKKRPRGVPFESYAIMEATDWDIPAKARRICVDD